MMIWYLYSPSLSRYRFLCKQSGMDDFAFGARFTLGHCRFPELGQIGSGTSLSDRFLYAGGVAGGGTLQEGVLYRWTKLFAAHTWRGRRSGDAGKNGNENKPLVNRSYPHHICMKWKNDVLLGTKVEGCPHAKSMGCTNKCLPLIIL